MKIGILGSGFGLYGYLPALIELGHSGILMPERYRATLRARAELRALEPAVNWQADVGALIAQSEALFSVRRPVDQEVLVDKEIDFRVTKALYLEKPIARTPGAAAAMLEKLRRQGCNVQSGMFFTKLPWAHSLKAHLDSAQYAREFEIHWAFRAHHYQHDVDTWKRRVADGGGALRFFGIHLVALMAELGFTQVLSSRLEASAAGEAQNWMAVFGSAAGHICSFSVCSNALKQTFSVRADGHDLVSQADPFGSKAQQDGRDPRIPFLAKQIDAFLRSEQDARPLLDRTVAIWRDAERTAKTGTF